MGMKPKTTREHILSLYGHISGVKKNLSHVHQDVEKLGGKIDKFYWVLLTVAGTAVVFVLDKDILHEIKSEFFFKRAYQIADSGA